MFLKSANLFRIKSLSLVTKLMLFYSLSTITLLSVIGIFLYPTFLKIMEEVNGNAASYITAECYEKSIIILLFGSLCAILFGHIIARKGLNRIRELEEKMEQITVNSLHERIDINEWPKELNHFGERFNAMLDRIQTSFNQLSQFSSDIAHELRTPLHNLINATEITLSKNNHPDVYQTLLENNMKEYMHLSKLIENLLFLARSDNGQLILKKEMISAREEILNLYDYYQALADENNIKLICHGDGKIYADPILFKRVLNNLIINSLKYTLSNGVITIDVQSNDQCSHISIHDTGIGISEHHQARLFDRFYRVDSARSNSSGGLGLGLAIVKSIIDLHKGKIWIESKLNIGTSIILQLPH